MPDELSRAVADLGEPFSQKAFNNWVEIGDEGRDAYRRYLDRACPARGLRKGSELAATQLCHPGTGYPLASGG